MGMRARARQGNAQAFGGIDPFNSSHYEPSASVKYPYAITKVAKYIQNLLLCNIDSIGITTVCMAPEMNDRDSANSAQTFSLEITRPVLIY